MNLTFVVMAVVAGVMSMITFRSPSTPELLLAEAMPQDPAHHLAANVRPTNLVGNGLTELLPCQRRASLVQPLVAAAMATKRACTWEGELCAYEAYLAFSRTCGVIEKFTSRELCTQPRRPVEKPATPDRVCRWTMYAGRHTEKKIRVESPPLARTVAN